MSTRRWIQTMDATAAHVRAIAPASASARVYGPRPRRSTTRAPANLSITSTHPGARPPLLWVDTQDCEIRMLRHRLLDVAHARRIGRRDHPLAGDQRRALNHADHVQ